MNRIVIIILLATILPTYSLTVLTSNDELNKRLLSCTPTKDFNAGGSTVYQISGLTGSTCIFKIQNKVKSKNPDLICKVPYNRMREITSYNPITVQNAKKRYCVMSIKSLRSL